MGAGDSVLLNYRRKDRKGMESGSPDESSGVTQRFKHTSSTK